MKKLLILPLSAILLSSCSEPIEDSVEAPQPVPLTIPLETPEDLVSTTPIETVFPIDTTLTDTKGKSINVRIFGKNADRISVIRIPSGQRFILTLDQLSEPDQQRLIEIADGGVFHSIEHRRHEAVLAENPPTPSFPLERHLTDTKGRSINARILGKSGPRISIATIPSGQQFILDLDKLSEPDRALLADLADGGVFESSEPTTLEARNAVWHWHIENARKEASKHGIPMLLAVSNGSDKQAANFEKVLLFSSELRDWASENAALCLIRVGSGSGENSFDAWKDLAGYGIPQTTKSALTLYNPETDTARAIDVSKVWSGAATIDALDEALLEESTWASIEAAPTPTNQQPPVNIDKAATAVRRTS